MSIVPNEDDKLNGGKADVVLGLVEQRKRSVSSGVMAEVFWTVRFAARAAETVLASSSDINFSFPRCDATTDK